MAKLPAQTRPASDSSSDSERRERPVVPENTILDVVVEKCELRELNEDFRQKFKIRDTHEVNFTFLVEGGPYNDLKLWGSAKPYINDSDNCRLRIWAKEIMGVDELPDGFAENFDTDDLQGLRCRILVKEYTKANGARGNKVAEVLRSVNQSNGFAHTADEPF